jgi:ankyrin repeat protein
MIEYCLESVECDPDIEIKSTDQLKKSDEEQNNDDDDDENEEEENEEEENEAEENENPEQIDQPSPPINTENSDLKLKETGVFSLLSTVSFIDSTEKHPLEIFLKKTKNPNVLHHKTHRTPLLEAISLQQTQTAQMLINNSLCDINLSTSNLLNERQQTPLIFSCKLQLLPVILSLLNHKQCNISSIDYENNQAIHYYLQTSNRSNEYLNILNIFIKNLKLISKNALNIQGKHQRTPLHIAVYHNLGTINAITDIEKVLIENGSDLLMKDNIGNLPLHNVFLNKKIGDDPVELCVLIIKSMKYKSIDTQNNEGDTPLHLAVVSFFLFFK